MTAGKTYNARHGSDHFATLLQKPFTSAMIRYSVIIREDVSRIALVYRYSNANVRFSIMR
jgi:hypothetical protein